MSNQTSKREPEMSDTITVKIFSRLGETNVLFSTEVNLVVSLRGRIRAAVQIAVKSGANLSRADLSKANLRGANLSSADLSGADLSSADLSNADLSGAVLRSANLRGADLSGAGLSRADLSCADLSRAGLSCTDLSSADLRFANLRGANLSSADLSGADLSGADLSNADLSGADLRSANLRGADLIDVKQDFLAEVIRLPNELEALRDALVAGKVNGSSYTGECACLAGTLGKAKGFVGSYLVGAFGPEITAFHIDAISPRERFFTAIKAGDTPETNAASAVALDWTNEAIAIRDHIRAVTP